MIEDVLLSEKDRGFLNRLRASPEVYRSRIEQIGFKGLEHVLDAGCGFGQWTLELAILNKKVSAIDFDSTRILVNKRTIDGEGITNVTFKTGSLENLPYEDELFDGIFCFSVLYLTDYECALREFFRVLKPGGKLYFTTNALGRTLYHIIKNPHPTPDYNPRIAGIKALIKMASSGFFCSNASSIMFPSTVEKKLKDIGFSISHVGLEGSLKSSGPKSAGFVTRKYFGLTQIFEVLAKR